MSVEGESQTTGDVSSAGLEYAEIRGVLERALRRICPAWLAADRDDLAQDAVIRVMEIARRDAFSGEKSREFSSSYLWRTAQSVLIDELRRRRRRSEVELPDHPGEAIDGGPVGSPDPHREARGREIGRELWDCLGGLVKPRRMAVALHLEGYTPSEASPILGWNTKKVYNLVHRGMQDLRQCMQQKGLEP